MTPHLMSLCEQVPKTAEENQFEYTRLREKFSTTGFTMANVNWIDAIVLTGQKKLASGKVLKLNTPLTLFDPETEMYPETEDLIEAHKCLVEEIINYIKNTPQEENNQLSLPFAQPQLVLAE